jgi:7-cyano-7-deazaguanine synthase
MVNCLTIRYGNQQFSKEYPMDQQKTALVLFSGGQDSSVCLAWALARFAHVETVGFDYGQVHAVEMQTRSGFLQEYRTRFPKIARHLGEDHLIDLSGFGKISESSLAGKPAAKRRKDGLPDTYVPGRNLMFFIAAAALAERRGLEALVGGMCETDYSGYPDCRRKALDAVEDVLELGMELPLPILTPLMHLTKAETWALSKKLGGDALVELIVQQSHTCYAGDREHLHEWGYGCGSCDACQLRARGFAQWQAQL